MTLKWKAIIGLVACILLFAVGYSIWSWAGMRSIEKKLKEAKVTVERLMGEKDSLKTKWANRERELENQKKRLNSRLAKLQKENDVLANKIQEFEKQRANVIVPDQPDDICPEFDQSGYRSCTRVGRPKR